MVISSQRLRLPIRHLLATFYHTVLYNHRVVLFFLNEKQIKKMQIKEQRDNTSYLEVFFADVINLPASENS